MKRLAPCLTFVVAVAVSACSPSATQTPPATTAPPPTATPAPAYSPRDSAQLTWSFETKGAIWGSASVRDGVVYVGSNDGSLYAVDAKTGARKWQFETAGEVRTAAAFADQSIVFSSDDGFVYALDLAGKQLWKTDIHSNLKRRPLNDPDANYDYDFLASSPVVSGGRIFAGSSDGSLYALDAKTGAVVWHYETKDRIRATAAVADGTVYVGSWDGYFYALKADSGELVWKYRAGGDSEPKYLVGPVTSSAMVRDGVVYCASRKAITFALDTKTGKELWQQGNGPGNWFESSPVVAGNMVYIGSSLASTLNAFDAVKGFRTGSYNIAAAAWSTPMVAGGLVFIGSEALPGGPDPVAQGGGMYAVNLEGGMPTTKRWFFPIETTLEPTGIAGVNSSPVLVDGTLYFGGLDGKLYALAV